MHVERERLQKGQQQEQYYFSSFAGSGTSGQPCHLQLNNSSCISVSRKTAVLSALIGCRVDGQLYIPAFVNTAGIEVLGVGTRDGCPTRRT